MESTLQKPAALAAAKTIPKAKTIVLLDRHRALLPGDELHRLLQLLRLPEVAQAFTRLGFPAGYFRVELSWAKLVGVAACLRPWSPRGSRSGPTPASPSTSPRRSSPTSRWAMARRRGARSAATSVLWGLSYFFWRRLQARRRTPDRARRDRSQRDAERS